MTDLTESEQFTRHLTPQSVLILTLVTMLCGLLMSSTAYVVWKQYQPQIVQPGEIIDSPGEYQLPGGRVLVSLTPAGSAGEIQWKASSPHASGAMKVDAASDWFCSIDQYERAWLFDPQHGVYHWNETPGGGSRTTSVGVGGGWQGVPDTFLEKLPDKHREDYQEWASQQGLTHEE